MQIITFDFHNTVARCEPWFDLEIRNLPAEVIREVSGIDADHATIERATTMYRTLRGAVMASGEERDALTCVQHVFSELALDIDEAVLPRTIDVLMRRCMAALEPEPGAVETITSLTDAGIPVGIISSAVYHPFLEWSLERFGILDRLAFVATSASVGFYKSVVAIYEEAYALVNADRALSVHIGDSPRWDIETARLAGLGTVLYAPSGLPVPLDDGAQPDLVLTSLERAHGPLMELLERRKAQSVA